jgi:hypothetical protein
VKKGHRYCNGPSSGSTQHQRAEAGARPRSGSAAGPVSRSRSKEGVYFALCCHDLSIHYGLHRRGCAKGRMGARAGPFRPEAHRPASSTAQAGASVEAKRRRYG